MAKQKNGRGRPKGDGVDDSALLARIADLIRVGAASNPTAALKQIKPGAEETEQRRVQRKWKARHVDLIAEANARHTKSVSAPQPPVRHANYLAQIAALSASAKAFEVAQSPAFEAFWRFQNSPQMQKIRALQQSPAFQRILALQASPQMQAIRDQHRLLGEVLARR
jgi:hypothetical protein